LGNGSYEDLIKYCYSSNKTLQSCNTNYIRNTIIDKFLPPRLDYRQYTIEELFQLGKFYNMHVLDLYLHIKSYEDRLAEKFINSYILPFMIDDNYDKIDESDTRLNWLLDLNTDSIMLLCGLMYPIDSLLDIIVLYPTASSKSYFKLDNIFSRMFWTKRSKEDIVAVYRK
ncbi:Hypothetical protein ORPV_638, partial [Orpheovirus IHUMI-LCC2]